MALGEPSECDAARVFAGIGVVALDARKRLGFRSAFEEFVRTARRDHRIARSGDVENGPAREQRQRRFEQRFGLRDEFGQGEAVKSTRAPPPSASSAAGRPQPVAIEIAPAMRESCAATRSAVVAPMLCPQA
jgi:hypothetical protein